MLKDLPATVGTGLHGSIPPRRYWAYYTWQEIDAIAKRDPNATAVINVAPSSSTDRTCRSSPIRSSAWSSSARRWRSCPTT